ncbi:MAG TPA: S24 family peptidase [Candidatus Acidoferrum sp.]|nr:S24 family peptidase [Candidatus Acidoferrum sp.]
METRLERRKSPDHVRGERRAGDALRIADALKRRGRISLRVHGTSMLPWVRPGDIALIRMVSGENVRCGDVVLFRREDHLFVHRIVEKRGSLDAAELLSKGDAQPASDGVVGEQELLGRVVRIYRGGRRINLDTPVQLALGVFISQLSLHSRFWYPLAKFAAIVTRPARRVMKALHISSAAVR